MPFLYCGIDERVPIRFGVNTTLTDVSACEILADGPTTIFVDSKRPLAVLCAAYLMPYDRLR